ncbi:hypothetical protein CRI94_04500 [Longibacter salinarum]|uniref:Uncharacterized protein n=1 Tax=Longibacter salinarum TaxID=1850348 RepID=A0A2A8D0F6_9BACT|nr:hypothetical protein [Longibacter salinarum]PEN14303.1 hypothetical protein CRI94_04500 [Longibacter salinarum]
MATRATSFLFTLFLAVTLTMGLTACDSSDSDDGMSFGGSADVTVSGASGGGGDFSGNSLFATSNDLDQTEPAFSIVMFNVTSSDTTIVAIGRDGDALPRTGSFDIGDGSESTEKFTGVYIYSDGGDMPNLGISKSGTLNLSTATESKMTGDFNFSAVHPFGTSDMSVSGSFDADRATPEQIDELESVLNEY